MYMRWKEKIKSTEVILRLPDNSGSIYINNVDKGDYGSFPPDNRRAAYSTIIDNVLYIVYKYGPEVLTVDIDASADNKDVLSSKDTSDINNETVVGIKAKDGYYYVVTEESEVIRTQFN